VILELTRHTSLPPPFDGAGSPLVADSDAGHADWTVPSMYLSPDTAHERAELENFPVASRLLPSRVRRHLFALYGFARLVDDIGDESTGDRLAELDAVERDLDRVFSGHPPEHPVLARLVPTVWACGLADGPFRRLIQANRQDQQVRRYADLAGLLAYCDLSANPVGELVLGIFGALTPDRLRASDAVCTALQLVEHLQDVAEDLGRDRIYLPQDDIARFGVTEADLALRPAPRQVRQLVALEARRARDWLAIGADLDGYLRLAVAGFVAGGQATLDAMAAVDHDVLTHRVRPSRARTASRAARLLLGRR
jgi:squalene synthase HpnC